MDKHNNNFILTTYKYTLSYPRRKKEEKKKGE